MTPQEHELIARMFAKQFRYIELLVNILQSRDIIEGDDLAAFLSALRADAERDAFALQSAKAEYRRLAKDIGLAVTFPKAR
jgi:hypothetical protein